MGEVLEQLGDTRKAPSEILTKKRACEIRDFVKVFFEGNSKPSNLGEMSKKQENIEPGSEHGLDHIGQEIAR